MTQSQPTRMVSEPIRILYIIDFWASPGGTERHLSHLLSSLDRSRYKCHVVIFNYAPNALVDRARADGVEIIHLPVARYYTPNALLQAVRLLKIIRARGIDIVQTFHYKSDVYGATVARLAGVRHIISSKRDAADYKSAFRFFLHKLVRPFTQRYIAVSEAVADVVQRKEGVPAERISVIYNGVDIRNYSVPDAAAKANAKVALGFEADAFVIGMSAWFRPEKDHQLIIDAYLAIAAGAPNARLAFVGGGPLFEHYRDWVKTHGLDARIKFVGAVDDVRGALRSFDVACLVPKINEGFSNSVLEKMAMGLPVIVTDVGGNKEAIAEGVNGYVIAAGARAKLEEHLLSLYMNPGLRERMSAESRRRAEQLFSLNQMIDRHESLYASVAGCETGKAA